VPEIFALITGITRPVSTPATLPDFERRRLSGKPYPGIRPAHGAKVEGVLYPITKLVLPALDRYEGDMYQRMSVRVQTGTSDSNAWTYVLRSRYCHLMQAADWRLAEFQARHLPQYLAQLQQTRRAPR
jgi:hypothetical protein